MIFLQSQRLTITISIFLFIYTANILFDAKLLLKIWAKDDQECANYY